jgi:galactose mutarotase-like enzyme
MFKLENNNFSIAILQTGAELRSVMNKYSGYEYIWQADASVWNRSSPVLFPFVGKLKNDTYFFKGKEYHLPQHGFARNYDFELLNHQENKAVFILKSNSSTKENYPFDFELKLSYTLTGNELQLEYAVKNTGDQPMCFSLGAHPAFNLPEGLENYLLEFEKEERLPRHLLKAGLRTQVLESVPIMGNRLALKEEYFEEDAIVFKGMQSKEISIINLQNKKLISLEAEGFPYYGIWAKKPYPFLCLEPWHGIADSQVATGELTEKEGLRTLASSEIFLSRITFRFF